MRIKVEEIERQRILEMHQTARNQNMINEQAQTQTGTTETTPGKTGTQGGIRGAVSRVKTGVQNVKSAVTGNIQNIKDPELEAILTRLKANTKQTQRQLTDTFNNFRDLKANIDTNKIEPINQDELKQLTGYIDSYMKVLQYTINETNKFNQLNIAYNNSTQAPTGTQGINPSNLVPERPKTGRTTTA
jgi:hypothetical protein